MITPDDFRTLALQFTEATEVPHFENASFRVKKKIFASLNTKENRGVLKLTEMQQSVYCVWDTTACYPVPNKWGKQGWTIVELGKIDAEFAEDILKTAYCNVAPKKLAEMYSID